MFEKFPEIWNLIKGRVITDLNLLAVGLLIWMLSNENSASIPIIAHLPGIVQPIAKVIFPVAWGLIVQVLVKLTRQDAAKEAEANAIFNQLTHDAGQFIQHPTAANGAIIVRNDVLPVVEHSIEEAVPAAAEVIKEVAPKIEAIPTELATGQHVDLGGIAATVISAAEPAIGTVVANGFTTVANNLGIVPNTPANITITAA